MSHRPAKIASVIRQVVAIEALNIPPDLAQVVNVTEVKVSSDFSYADVFVTALKNPQQAIKHLKKRQGSLRRSLARELQMYRIPILRLVIDRRGEEGEKIERLLR